MDVDGRRNFYGGVFFFHAPGQKMPERASCAIAAAAAYLRFPAGEPTCAGRTCFLRRVPPRRRSELSTQYLVVFGCGSPV